MLSLLALNACVTNSNGSWWTRSTSCSGHLVVRSCGANFTLIHPPDAVPSNLTLLTAVGAEVSEESWSTVRAGIVSSLGDIPLCVLACIAGC